MSIDLNKTVTLAHGAGGRQTASLIHEVFQQHFTNPEFTSDDAAILPIGGIKAAFTTDGTLIHMNPATENLLGVRVEQKLSFDEMFADLDMPDTDETVSRSFLTNEITRFGRVLSVTLAPYGALDGAETTISFPTSLFASISELQITPICSANVVFTSVVSVTASTITVKVITTASSSVTVQMSVHAIGK